MEESGRPRLSHTQKIVFGSNPTSASKENKMKTRIRDVVIGFVGAIVIAADAGFRRVRAKSLSSGAREYLEEEWYINPDIRDVPIDMIPLLRDAPQDEQDRADEIIEWAYSHGVFYEGDWMPPELSNGS